MTKTKEEILKGCGKEWKATEEEETIICGNGYGQDLCSSCQAKLEGYNLGVKETAESINEEWKEKIKRPDCFCNNEGSFKQFCKECKDSKLILMDVLKQKKWNRSRENCVNIMLETINEWKKYYREALLNSGDNHSQEGKTKPFNPGQRRNSEMPSSDGKDKTAPCDTSQEICENCGENNSKDDLCDINLNLNGFFSKWGFDDGDGDLVDKYTYYYQNVFTSRELFNLIIKKLVLKNIKSKIKFVFINSCHNENRISMIDGIEVDWFNNVEYKIIPSELCIKRQDILTLCESLVQKKAEEEMGK